MQTQLKYSTNFTIPKLLFHEYNALMECCKNIQNECVSKSKNKDSIIGNKKYIWLLNQYLDKIINDINLLHKNRLQSYMHPQYLVEYMSDLSYQLKTISKTRMIEAILHMIHNIVTGKTSDKNMSDLLLLIIARYTQFIKYAPKYDSVDDIIEHPLMFIMPSPCDGESYNQSIEYNEMIEATFDDFMDYMNDVEPEKCRAEYVRGYMNKFWYTVYATMELYINDAYKTLLNALGSMKVNDANIYKNVKNDVFETYKENIANKFIKQTSIFRASRYMANTVKMYKYGKYSIEKVKRYFVNNLWQIFMLLEYGEPQITVDHHENKIIIDMYLMKKTITIESLENKNTSEKLEKNGNVYEISENNPPMPYVNEIYKIKSPHLLN